MAGIWLQQSDIVNVLSVTTFAAIFNDPVTGITNGDIVNAVIERAEQEVLSWLVDEYGTTVQNATNLAGDLFLKGCALEYAYAFSFDRYPEYVRANGPERAERYDRAEARMQRVLQSRQRPTSLPQLPANVGGVSVDNGPRIMVDGADGTYNGGDYILLATTECDAMMGTPRCLRWVR
jgi:hypothetical protein